MDKLFPLFMLLGFLSPCAAIVSAFLPDRRVPAVAFALAVIVCGAIGGYFGLFFGIERACYGPTARNLCGLWGFFVTGPIALALTILTLGLALSLIQPMPKPDDENSN